MSSSPRATPSELCGACPADREILFVPDQNLGEWVIEKTGRKMRLWQGNCYIHIEFTHASISKDPQARASQRTSWWRILSARWAVRMLADEVCSTEKMMSYCRENPAKSFIIATESGMLNRPLGQGYSRTRNSFPVRPTNAPAPIAAT